MKKTVSKPSKQRGRRRIQVSLAERKTLAFYQEAKRMLAIRDFEDISIAQLAKATGCSVGAFYVRFKDKDSFLNFVILHTFGQAQRRFSAALPAITTQEQPGEVLAEHLIADFANAEFAGAVRTAIKLGFSDVAHRHSFDVYREHVADQFIDRTESKDPKTEDANRIAAVQAVLGVLTDAVTSRDSIAPPNWQSIRPILCGILSQSKAGSLEAAKPSPDDASEEIQTRPSKI